MGRVSVEVLGTRADYVLLGGECWLEGDSVVTFFRSVVEGLAAVALKNISSFTASFDFHIDAPQAGHVQQPIRIHSLKKGNSDKREEPFEPAES